MFQAMSPHPSFAPLVAASSRAGKGKGKPGPPSHTSWLYSLLENQLICFHCMFLLILVEDDFRIGTSCRPSHPSPPPPLQHSHCDCMPVLCAQHCWIPAECSWHSTVPAPLYPLSCPGVSMSVWVYSSPAASWLLAAALHRGSAIAGTPQLCVTSHHFTHSQQFLFTVCF